MRALDLEIPRTFLVSSFNDNPHNFRTIDIILYSPAILGLFLVLMHDLEKILFTLLGRNSHPSGDRIVVW